METWSTNIFYLFFLIRPELPKGILILAAQEVIKENNMVGVLERKVNMMAMMRSTGNFQF